MFTTFGIAALVIFIDGVFGGIIGVQVVGVMLFTALFFTFLLLFFKQQKTRNKKRLSVTSEAKPNLCILNMLVREKRKTTDDSTRNSINVRYKLF